MRIDTGKELPRVLGVGEHGVGSHRSARGLLKEIISKPERVGAGIGPETDDYHGQTDYRFI